MTCGVGITTAIITHHCPYKGRTVALWSCYLSAEDLENRECYGCDQVPRLKAHYGLRTYVRKAVLARCRHCDEVFGLHRKEWPHKGVRIPWCPGFETTSPPDVRSVEEQRSESDVIHVPLDEGCRTWMVVFTKTGERLTYAAYREWAFNRMSPGMRKVLKWTIHQQVNRFKLPLAGAPDFVPEDRLTPKRREAFNQAERWRRQQPVTANTATVSDVVKKEKKK